MSDKKLDYLNTALNVHQSATLESIKKQNHMVQLKVDDFEYEGIKLGVISLSIRRLDYL